MGAFQMTAGQKMSPLVVGCLLATWLVWGSTYLAIRFALVSFPPFFQMGTRFLTAGLLLIAWMLLRRAPWPDARQWRNALIVGALMLGGGMGGTAFAEQTVASGLVVAFIAVVPALIALASLAFGVKPSRLEVVGIGVGLIGVLFLVGGAGFGASHVGLFAIATSTICWSTGSVLSIHRFELAPGGMGFASEMICGGGVLLTVSALTGESFHWPPQTSAALAWGYLVVFGSLLAFNAYMLLLKRASGTLASSYTFVNPVIALLLGVSLGGEHVTAREWSATGIIVSGVLMLLSARRSGSR
jgi:drug/metabolite transporter (DMT)-like permease